MSGFLSPYRVLDLSDERGLLAGHMFAQLGADVIQLEPIAGSSARAVGPIADDAPAGDNSFFWSAYASGKKSLACDLSLPAGRELLQRLIQSADFLIESADAQQRVLWNMTPEKTAALNPALIHVSITAFGSSGPKADYAASDLTIWAAGGALLPSRDTTRSPLRISVAQSWLNASADAAGGALIAHFSRLQSGRGQHVDVSAQQSAALCTMSASLAVPVGHPDYTIPGAIAAEKKNAVAVEKKKDGKKDLDLSGSGSHTRRSKWQAKDGMVEMHIGIGPAGGRFANNLFKWLASENACDADIATWDFVSVPQRILNDEISEHDMERARNNVAKFFANFTKEELLEQAMARRFLCAPIATTQDLLDSRQLAARHFYATVTEASGAKRVLPGNFAAGVAHGFAPPTPAPTLGQHTDNVLRDWLALDLSAIEQLRAQGVIR